MNTKPFTILGLLLAALFVSTSHAGQKPNVILIFIDDMGYGGIEAFGHPAFKTPNLERMAAEGHSLRRFYTSNTACTPSRAALLTGTYAGRIGMDGDVHFPGEPWGLNPGEFTIAELFSEAGYTTACIGKWHLGDQSEFLPLAQGFDRFHGIPYSNDMWPGNPKGHRQYKVPYTPLPLVEGNQAVAWVSDAFDQALLAEAFTDQAVGWIRDVTANKDRKPFFLYFPHANVHAPRYARREYFDRAEGDVYRAHTEEIDDSMGRLFTAIRELGIEKETLVIFTSDNGGAGGGGPHIMGGLRGGKGGAKYEGHMREPFIAWWPGTIPAGSESSETALTIDLLPSFARLLGGQLPQDRVIDGRDNLDVLLGLPEAKSPHKVQHYEADGVRRDGWKLVRTGKRDELYYLPDDPGEKENLASTKPAMVSKLVALCEAHAADLVDPEKFRPRGKLAHETTPLIPYAHELPKLRQLLGIPFGEVLDVAGKIVPEGEFGRKK